MANLPSNQHPTPAEMKRFTKCDVYEDDKDLWLMEQEIFSKMERVKYKHADHPPIGKSSSEVKQTVRKNSIAHTLARRYPFLRDAFLELAGTEGDSETEGNSEIEVDDSADDNGNELHGNLPDDEDEEEEEEDDNDDEESESHDDEEEGEEIDMDLDDAPIEAQSSHASQF